MFNNIIDPVNNQKYAINSKQAKQILKKYIKTFLGGTRKKKKKGKRKPGKKIDLRPTGERDRQGAWQGRGRRGQNPKPKTANEADKTGAVSTNWRKSKADKTGAVSTNWRKSKADKTGAVSSKGAIQKTPNAWTTNAGTNLFKESAEQNTTKPQSTMVFSTTDPPTTNPQSTMVFSTTDPPTTNPQLTTVSTSTLKTMPTQEQLQKIPPDKKNIVNICIYIPYPSNEEDLQPANFKQYVIKNFIDYQKNHLTKKIIKINSVDVAEGSPKPIIKIRTLVLREEEYKHQPMFTNDTVPKIIRDQLKQSLIQSMIDEGVIEEVQVTSFYTEMKAYCEDVLFKDMKTPIRDKSGQYSTIEYPIIDAIFFCEPHNSRKTLQTLHTGSSYDLMKLISTFYELHHGNNVLTMDSNVIIYSYQKLMNLTFFQQPQHEAFYIQFYDYNLKITNKLHYHPYMSKTDPHSFAFNLQNNLKSKIVATVRVNNFTFEHVIWSVYENTFLDNLKLVEEIRPKIKRVKLNRSPREKIMFRLTKLVVPRMTRTWDKIKPKERNPIDKLGFKPITVGDAEIDIKAFIQIIKKYLVSANIDSQETWSDRRDYFLSFCDKDKDNEAILQFIQENYALLKRRCRSLVNDKLLTRDTNVISGNVSKLQSYDPAVTPQSEGSLQYYPARFSLGSSIIPINVIQILLDYYSLQHSVHYAHRGELKMCEFIAQLNLIGEDLGGEFFNPEYKVYQKIGEQLPKVPGIGDESYSGNVILNIETAEQLKWNVDEYTKENALTVEDIPDYFRSIEHKFYKLDPRITHRIVSDLRTIDNDKKIPEKYKAVVLDKINQYITPDKTFDETIIKQIYGEIVRENRPTSSLRPTRITEFSSSNDLTS